MNDKKEILNIALRAAMIAMLLLVFFQLGQMNVYNARQEIEQYINESCLKGVGNYSVGIDGSVAIWKDAPKMQMINVSDFNVG